MLKRKYDGISIRLSLPVNWTVILVHPLLRSIPKNILLQCHNCSISILHVGEFDQPCYQELLAMSLDINPLGNIESIRSPINKMDVLQLNVYGFSFIAFKNLMAKNKTPKLRANKRSYLSCLSRNEMRV